MPRPGVRWPLPLPLLTLLTLLLPHDVAQGQAPCTPSSSDCGWAFVAGQGGYMNCGAGQGAPVKSSGSANCAQACDGFPDVCIGKLPIDECRDRCASDALCHAVTWNSGSTECFPKTVPSACADFAKDPAGCKLGA